MLRDDSGDAGGRPSAPRNVLGDRLDVCSMTPKTGFFRDGCCNTSPNPAAMILRRRCPNAAFPV
jgi:uncharacterized protein (DUF2237 family)